jgi:ubiquinone biosynthesis protein
MELTTNRMSLTILIAALLVSSSLIALAKVPPFIGSLPVLGFVGYLVAIILSFVLAASILFRRGPPR